MIYPGVVNETVGHNFPKDFEIAVSEDGQTYKTVLSVVDYAVSSPRAEKSQYVWDPDLNNYKKCLAV